MCPPNSGHCAQCQGTLVHCPVNEGEIGVLKKLPKLKEK